MYVQNDYSSANAISPYSYWEFMGGDYFGTFRGSKAWYDIKYTQRGASAGMYGGGIIGSAVGLTAGAYLSAKLGLTGAAIGTGILPGIGTVAGFVIGAVAGAVGGWLGATYGAKAGAWLGSRAGAFAYGMSGGPSAYEFRVPFVNTRMAATMRQASMQNMMMGFGNYRNILQREAIRMHR